MFREIGSDTELCFAGEITHEFGVPSLLRLTEGACESFVLTHFLDCCLSNETGVLFM